MRKLALGTFIGLVIALSACGGSSVISKGPLTLTFTGGKLVGPRNATSFTIKSGVVVQFVDPASGMTHFLATGTQGLFAREAGAPSVLSSNPGKEIDPGQTVEIPFSTPGIYHVTCTIHTGQNVTIVVK